MEPWENVEAVQRMQDYIQSHLAESMTLAQLARAAGYSQWHSARLFKKLVGRTPFEYIRALRLSEAAMSLRNGAPKIVDVAFDFVFDSHEGFTKAFAKQFGLSPREYSREKPAIQLFIPYSVRAYHLTLQHEKGESVMSESKKVLPLFVQIVERPARKVMLKRGKKAEEYFAYCEECGCDVWGVLTSIPEALQEPIGMWLPDKLITAGTSKYVQGVELPLDYNKTVPEGFEIVELPPCKMMVFQGPAYDDDAFMSEIEQVWEAIDQYNPQVYGYEWAPQEAPRYQLAPMGYRGYIEARPVRALNQ